MLARLIPRRLGEGEEAELVDHLGELRHRLFVTLGAFVPAFALAFAFHGRLVAALREPLPDGRRLVTLGVTEPFTVSVKVSVVAALALALPVLLWQAWAFVAPGRVEVSGALENRLTRLEIEEAKPPRVDRELDALPLARPALARHASDETKPLGDLVLLSLLHILRLHRGRVDTEV